MKWIAGLLAALVLAMPLAVAQEATVQAETKAEAKTVSVFDLRLRQIGQAFGDFVFHIKKVLTFDEKAKVELIKERNAEMKARQQAWLETKANALAQFESGNMTAEEKQQVISTLHAEHEAIIKEHLRTTEEIRELQLRAKAKGDAELEHKAQTEAELTEESGLSEGLKIREALKAGARVQGNVALNEEARATLSALVSSLSSTQSNAELEMEVKKENGSAEVDAEVEGSLTAEQNSLWLRLQDQANALVEASSSSNAKLKIEIESAFAAKGETNLTSEEAKLLVKTKLGFETGAVTTQSRGGTTFFVVTGTDTETTGGFVLAKNFEVWVQADTGLITSVDLDTHIEAISVGAGGNSGVGIGV
ncbi:MAG: hypothetical protein HYU56_05120 [Candidatus Aenigmarchaeota archaeon]|nr:hypothetical protein [Candidatus Aenigmarchaeota archaeon]